MIITTKAVALVLIGSTTLGIVYWRVQMHPEATAVHAVIVADLSESVTHEPGAIVGIAETFLQRRKLPRGSTLSVIATGDEGTRNEPRLVGRYDAPYSRRAVEGKSALAEKRKEILADLRSRMENVEPTNRSPVFLAIKRAVEQLRASGCASDSDCVLFVRSDGEELSEKSIRESISGAGKPKKLPEAISNEGIRVLFCGLAEVNAARHAEARRTPKDRSADHGDRVRAVWRSLFSMPDLVSFEPYCPKTETSGER